jgi:hypothetical protein
MILVSWRPYYSTRTVPPQLSAAMLSFLLLLSFASTVGSTMLTADEIAQVKKICGQTAQIPIGTYQYVSGECGNCSVTLQPHLNKNPKIGSPIVDIGVSNCPWTCWNTYIDGSLTLIPSGEPRSAKKKRMIGGTDVKMMRTGADPNIIVVHPFPWVVAIKSELNICHSN